MRHGWFWRRAAALIPLVLSGCMLGPDYKRLPAIAAAQYKELAGWKAATPSDTLDRGAWWSIYHDPVLDGLQRQVAASNQTLKAQEAAFRQAVAAVAEARAQLFPTVGVTTAAQRSSSGSGTFTTSSGTTGTASGTGLSGSSGGFTRTSYSLEGTVDWELDLWGRIRRQVESNVSAAQASAADVANIRLSAEGQLAVDYFELRAADSLAALLDQTVHDFREALRITENQYNAGVAARGDVITAQTQLQSAVASAINVGVQRATLEHAIAVLIGRAPADLSIPPAPLAARIPVVPPGVPSTLLAR